MSVSAALIAVTVAGPFIGSFLATAVERQARGLDWIAGRSHCDGCHRALPARALVPILSYAGQGGRARCCHCDIPLNCTLTELVCLAIPVSAWAAGLASAGGETVLVACFLGWSLVALSLADLQEGRLPDIMTMPLTLGGLIWIATSRGDVPDHLSAALLGYGILYTINLGYRALRGRDGLGMGDAKLLMAAGAWCGTLALPGIVLIGCLATLAGALVLSTRDELAFKTTLPFGPGLALGAWVSFLMGPLLWGVAPW